jgi:hypothetical protein
MSLGELLRSYLLNRSNSNGSGFSRRNFLVGFSAKEQVMIDHGWRSLRLIRVQLPAISFPLLYGFADLLVMT